MAKQKEEEAPPAGSPAWMATFSDLMTLLLCFFVLLYSMSTIDEVKFQAMAESFNQTFSILNGGATAIGDGMLISNGVSQLNELDQYINSTGKTADSAEESEEMKEFEQLLEEIEKEQLAEAENLAEQMYEGVQETNIADQVEVSFNSQYVQLTLKGALLFNSGSAELKQESFDVLDKVGVLLERYAESIIEIEGHTDNVPMSGGGHYANNNELSTARAWSVYDYFGETTSLDLAKMKASGRGEYVPIADNSTDAGRQMNRRVEIKIYHTLSTY